MQNLKKLVEFYQDLGIEELFSETPVNRLQKNVEKPEISTSNEILLDEEIMIDFNQNQERPIKISPEPQNIVNLNNSQNIITSNFSNMTQWEAISKLAQKQAQNNNQMEIKSIADIVKQAENIVSKIDNLADLEQAVRDFDGCSLKKMATNTVFKDGDAKSQIMIIGEAPGNHEDLQGIPFCGDSGKLLNEMFLAINRPRSELYITNTLFWRPPGNRKPTNDELAMCKPFVEKHIELIAPKLIVLMGATAMSGILGINDPIGQIHGKVLEYNNKYLTKPIKTITLFHPSYLMRQPSKKRLAWQDLIKIDNFLKDTHE